ncbi:hypothetical protein AMECASPLE_032344 [Ameca splendens]|uniref:Uncharacterized protein n=1 Tax=Ameca splendens TaxID=208324 RepID=A0ABV1ADK4_9TELE
MKTKKHSRRKKNEKNMSQDKTYQHIASLYKKAIKCQMALFASCLVGAKQTVLEKVLWSDETKINISGSYPKHYLRWKTITSRSLSAYIYTGPSQNISIL